MAYRIRNSATAEWLEWDCKVPARGRRSTDASAPHLVGVPMTEAEADEFLDMELRDCQEVIQPLRLFSITH